MCQPCSLKPGGGGAWWWCGGAWWLLYRPTIGPRSTFTVKMYSRYHVRDHLINSVHCVDMLHCIIGLSTVLD